MHPQPMRTYVQEMELGWHCERVIQFKILRCGNFIRPAYMALVHSSRKAVEEKGVISSIKMVKDLWRDMLQMRKI